MKRNITTFDQFKENCAIEVKRLLRDGRSVQHWRHAMYQSLCMRSFYESSWSAERVALFYVEQNYGSEVKP